jgi:high-affinity iron transporter
LWWNEVAVLAALIIVFREVFEAGLVVGIVMAVTRSVAQRGWWISGGVLGGLLGACVVAAFAGTLSAMFAGSGQELFNAGVLSLAVVMLTWHNVWMARHGRELAAEMRAVGEAVAAGQSSLFALAVVVGVAVLREGSEVVLFLYGIVATEGWSSVFAGGVAGLALGAVICALTYFGLLRIPGRYLFAATSLMIAFLAAGMASQAVAFLEQADVLTALGAVVWDSSWLLPDSGLIGRALHTLVGYSDRPTEMQLAAYAATLGATFLLMRLFAPVPKVAPAR